MAASLKADLSHDINRVTLGTLMEHFLKGIAYRTIIVCITSKVFIECYLVFTVFIRNLKTILKCDGTGKSHKSMTISVHLLFAFKFIHKHFEFGNLV